MNHTKNIDAKQKRTEELMKHARRIMHLVPISGGVPEILEEMPHEKIVDFSTHILNGDKQANGYLKRMSWSTYKRARSAAVGCESDMPEEAILFPIGLESGRWTLRISEVTDMEWR